jgi:hypothetical protein
MQMDPRLVQDDNLIRDSRIANDLPVTPNFHSFQSHLRPIRPARQNKMLRFWYMELNPTLASHYTAPARLAGPFKTSRNRVLRKRTPELHDSKAPTNKLTPQNTPKNAYNAAKKALKSQLFGPTNPSPSHPNAHPLIRTIIKGSLTL